jgi:hypothetical protein
VSAGLPVAATAASNVAKSAAGAAMVLKTQRLQARQLIRLQNYIEGAQPGGAKCASVAKSLQ